MLRFWSKPHHKIWVFFSLSFFSLLSSISEILIVQIQQIVFLLQSEIQTSFTHDFNIFMHLCVFLKKITTGAAQLQKSKSKTH